LSSFVGLNKSLNANDSFQNKIKFVGMASSVKILCHCKFATQELAIFFCISARKIKLKQYSSDEESKMEVSIMKPKIYAPPDSVIN
jgi:hypothetical protein